MNLLYFDFESSESKAFLVVVSCLVWTTICTLLESTIKFKTLTKKADHDVKNRFVSIIHGLVVMALAGYSLFHDQPSYTAKNSDVQIFVLLISMGYFIYDLLACIYYKICDRALVIHHSLAVFGYFISVYFGNSTLAMCGIFYGETSNSFMHIRAMLRVAGKRHTKLYELMEVVYMLTYIIARGVCITKINYDTALNSEIPFLLRFACLALWLQSLFFIKEMLGILQKKILQHKERRVKSVDYYWFSENPKVETLSYFRKAGKEKVF